MTLVLKDKTIKKLNPSMLMVLLLGTIAALPAGATTFVVNTTGDTSDNNTADNVCNDGSGACTLRAAIEQSNATVGKDTINFKIPGTDKHTIAPASALPEITDPVFINGYSQPGSSRNSLLDGNNATVKIALTGVKGYGLIISGGNSTVRGLSIYGNRNLDSSTYIGGQILLRNNGSNHITGNLIGIAGAYNDTSGGSWTGQNGVIIDNSPSNIIGGGRAEEHNVISGNGLVGVQISGELASHNRITGNIMGLKIPNNVAIYITGAPNNTIGGTTLGTRNFISRNMSGIQISGSAATGNIIQGNFIGTDSTGTTDRGNLYDGIYIHGSASNNTIGGTVSGAGNVISGNDRYGILIGYDYDFDLAPTRTADYYSNYNVIQGNFIGTDVTGTVDLGNTKHGISIGSSLGNTIGGGGSKARNVISGNGRHGVFSFGGANMVISGNYIGTDVTGTLDLGNSRDGVYMGVSNGSIIGGTDSKSRNVISGNDRNGISLSDSMNVAVSGNYIGTDDSGTKALGNAQGGISIGQATDSINIIVGGPNPAQGNIISSNARFGVYVYGGDGLSFVTQHTTIQGNYIGTDVTGANPLGNGYCGVDTAAARTTIGKGLDGTGSGNVIAFNGISSTSLSFPGPGILVEKTQCPVLSNSIHSNKGLGIFLVGTTTQVPPNDLGDSDTGGNDLQNFPVLLSAVSDGSTITIIGKLNSALQTRYRLEFFSNDSCDSSGFGEGQTFIGARNLTTGRRGNAHFAATFSVPVSVGQSITATATDPNGNTSEFSACVAVTAPLLPDAKAGVSSRSAGKTT